jgi:ornithine cyclodeaminase/alanine dehydrogenase-like protein (mu-crystallin family)
MSAPGVLMSGLLPDASRVHEKCTLSVGRWAVDELAPMRPLRIGLAGSGVEARNHVFAISAVRELESVAVFSPTEQRRRRLADEIRSSARHSPMRVRT